MTKFTKRDAQAVAEVMLRQHHTEAEEVVRRFIRYFRAHKMAAEAWQEVLTAIVSLRRKQSG